MRGVRNPPRARLPGVVALFRRDAFRDVGQHAEGSLVDIEQGFLLVEIVLVHAADLDDLAYDLGVETIPLGFGEDLLDVLRERLPFLLEPLNPLDDRAQLLAGNPPTSGIVPPRYSPIQAVCGWSPPATHPYPCRVRTGGRPRQWRHSEAAITVRVEPMPTVSAGLSRAMTRPSYADRASARRTR